MTTRKINLNWKSFKGIRNLNTINSDNELGADVIMNVSLSKEKSGQSRSIKSSGWFNNYLTMSEKVLRLFPANMSGYSSPNQLLAFTQTSSNINVWLIEDDISAYDTPVKIAAFPLSQDVTDVTMVQFGDRLVVACAFGTNGLGFICYSATELSGWEAKDNGFYSRYITVSETTTSIAVSEISSIVAYGSRLAINGRTKYNENGSEAIYGVWFSEAGNPLNFTSSYSTEATNTSAFFVETGEYVNKLVEYNGLTAGCRNRLFNISGTSEISVMPLTAKGVFGNAMFVLNGQCAYMDSYANNIFVLRNNIDGTIGFDAPIGDDIQDFISDMENVSVNSAGRRVRIIKDSGVSLIFDVDINEWTTEKFNPGSRAVTFLGKEIMCDGTTILKQITLERQSNSQQIPNEEGYFSHYKTNLIWLDSQTSIKSHIYPFAIILEPQTNNDFYVRFTTDRKTSYVARVTRAGFANVATYSASDEVPADGSKFVSSDDDLSGRVFFSSSGNDLLVTVDRPPYWRYLQVEIYTNAQGMEFNIAGIEAKQTFINDEQLDY
jgi:hypothetical protein